MFRRTFLKLATAAFLLAPFAATANQGIVEYQPGVLKQALARGDTVLVDFFAPWCSTCRAQERVVDELRRENPAYNAKITFIRVDWDTYAQKPVARDRAIPRRSTLVLLRGDKELGRVVAGTAKDQIKSLLDKGV